MRAILTVAAVAAVSGCAVPQSLRSPSTPPADAPVPAGLPPDKLTAALAATAAELARQGYDADAAAKYEEARRSCGQPERWAAELAGVYDRLGADDKAVAEFERALKVNPADPDVFNDYGCFHSARENWPAAETCFDQALRAKPGHPRATVNRAVVYAKTGRVELARAEFAKVLSPAEAEYNLGVLLAGRGDPTARDRLRSAAAAPDATRAKAVLARLDAGQGPAVRGAVFGPVSP